MSTILDQEWGLYMIKNLSHIATCWYHKLEGQDTKADPELVVSFLSRLSLWMEKNKPGAAYCENVFMPILRHLPAASIESRRSFRYGEQSPNKLLVADVTILSKRHRVATDGSYDSEFVSYLETIQSGIKGYLHQELDWSPMTSKFDEIRYEGTRLVTHDV